MFEWIHMGRQHWPVIKSRSHRMKDKGELTTSLSIIVVGGIFSHSTAHSVEQVKWRNKILLRKFLVESSDMEKPISTPLMALSQPFHENRTRLTDWLERLHRWPPCPRRLANPYCACTVQCCALRAPSVRTTFVNTSRKRRKIPSGRSRWVSSVLSYLLNFFFDTVFFYVGHMR